MGKLMSWQKGDFNEPYPPWEAYLKKQQSHDKEQMGKQKEKEDTVTEYFLRRYFQQNLDEDFMLDYCLTSNEREIMKLI